ncbi:MAG: hypothetical protein ABSF48_23555 [Thermodesulfobacteriota bacterium]
MLPPQHLGRFVVDIIAQLDLSKAHYLGEVPDAPVLTPADAGRAVER